MSFPAIFVLFLPVISNGNSSWNQTDTTTSNNYKQQHFVIYQWFGNITQIRQYINVTQLFEIRQIFHIMQHIH